ncbi:MAG: hypothetical protein U0Y96_16365 [Candidatus Kapaibacterium sp.]|nr:hypothetical protein [Bacteroidota bacterium]
MMNYFGVCGTKKKKISPSVFYILYNKDPERAYQLAKKTIQNATDFEYLNTTIYDDEVTSKKFLQVILDTILVRDRPFAIKQISKHIKEIAVLQFPLFANQALKTRDSTIINALFRRLKTEDNPHIYLKATKVLIAFKNKEIDRRIINISKVNPALKKDWGGKEFAELLKDNNIE